MADLAYYTRAGLDVQVKRSFDYMPATDNEWDRLLANARFNSIFQTSGWLRACADTYCKPGQLLVPEVRRDGRLIAAAALHERDGIIHFAGSERSDYCNLLVSRDLKEEDAVEAVEALLIAARDAAKQFRHFLLARIPAESDTAHYLQHSRFRLFPHIKRYSVAPIMDMSVASEKLRKKSLRRNENGLRREGDLQTRTFSHAAEIFPRLDEFFAQHIERWNGTPTPSLFEKEKNRLFYQRMIASLDQTGWLRFTEIRLDGSLIAAHLGWLYAGQFAWYKPTFDVNRGKHSPGEVLLKHVIEQAVADNAKKFDFLLGDETYKSRYATKTRHLLSFEIGDSRLVAIAKRIQRAAARRWPLGG